MGRRGQQVASKALQLVDLPMIPRTPTLQRRVQMDSAVYAIVESARSPSDQGFAIDMSDIFVPVTKGGWKYCRRMSQKIEVLFGGN
jgi:hypothetical protein